MNIGEYSIEAGVSGLMSAMVSTPTGHSQSPFKRSATSKLRQKRLSVYSVAMARRRSADDLNDDEVSRNVAEAELRWRGLQSIRDAIEENVELSEEELVRRAKVHQMRTACTIFDANSGQHAFRPLWGTGPADLGGYGVGVQLYFELLIRVGLVFGMLFVLSIPSLLLNLVGTRIDTSPTASDAMLLYRIVGYLSVANLGSCKSALDCRLDEDIYERALVEGGDWRVRDVAPLIGALDFVAVLSFMVFTAWSRTYWVPSAVAKHNAAQVTAADFSVCVSLLPRRLPQERHQHYEDEIREHFERLLRKEAEGAGGAGKRTSVEEVSLVREYNGAVRLFARQGELLKQRRDAEVGREKARRLGEEGGELLQRLELRSEQLSREIALIEETVESCGRQGSEDRDVILAFVMFRSEEHRNVILRAYRESRSYWFRCCQRHGLRFHGKRIKVAQACEPSDLYWQNLDGHGWRRRLRRCVTILLVASLIVMLLVFLVSLRSSRLSVDVDTAPHRLWFLRHPDSGGSTRPGCLRLCEWQSFEDEGCSPEGGRPMEVESVWGASEGRQGPGHRVFDGDLSCGGSPWASPGCGSAAAGGGGGDGDWIAVLYAEARSIRCARLTQPEGGLVDGLQVYACPDAGFNGTLPADWWVGCTRKLAIPMRRHQQDGGLPAGQVQRSLSVQADTACEHAVSLSTARLAQEQGENRVHGPRTSCFCSQEKKRVGWTFQLWPYSSPEQKLCEQWLSNRLKLQVFFGIGVMAVVVLNQVVLVLFYYLDIWVRFPTETDLARNQFLEFFFALLVTTGLLAFFAGMNLQDTVHDLEVLRTFNLGNGQYNDFSMAWFVDIGASIFFTVMSQVLMAPIFPVVWAKVRVRLLRRRLQGCYTEATMNDLYTLPDWEFPFRLADLAVVVFCVMMYSGAMPVVYLAGVFYCALSYWCDKWCLLRASRLPRQCDEKVVTTAIDMFAVASMAHLLITMGMYSHQAILPSDWSWLQRPWSYMLGVSLAQQEEYISSFLHGADDASDTTLRGERYRNFIRSRCLDTARESCGLLLLLFGAWGACAACFYVLSTVRTFCGSLEMVLEDFQERALGAIGLGAGGEAVTEEDYHEAKMRAVMDDALFSYSMAANERYKEAALGLRHDQARASDEEGSPSAGRQTSGGRKPGEAGMAGAALATSAELLAKADGMLGHILDGIEEERYMDSAVQGLQQGRRSFEVVTSGVAQGVTAAASGALQVLGLKRSQDFAASQDFASQDTDAEEIPAADAAARPEGAETSAQPSPGDAGEASGSRGKDAGDPGGAPGSPTDAMRPHASQDGRSSPSAAPAELDPGRVFLVETGGGLRAVGLGGLVQEREAEDLDVAEDAGELNVLGGARPQAFGPSDSRDCPALDFGRLRDAAERHQQRCYHWDQCCAAPPPGLPGGQRFSKVSRV